MPLLNMDAEADPGTEFPSHAETYILFRWAR